MAVSVSQVYAARPPGSEKFSVTDVALAAGYPTGGEPLTAAQLGLSSVIFAIATVKTVSGTVNITQAQYDVTNSKLIVYDETPAEVANAATLASNVIRVLAFGT